MVWAVFFWLMVVYCCLCYICVAILYFKIEVGLCNQTNVSNNKMHGALGHSPANLLNMFVNLSGLFLHFTKLKLFAVLEIIATENTNLNDVFCTLIRHSIMLCSSPLLLQKYPPDLWMHSTLKMCCDLWHQVVCSIYSLVN